MTSYILLKIMCIIIVLALIVKEANMVDKYRKLFKYLYQFIYIFATLLEIFALIMNVPIAITFTNITTVLTIFFIVDLQCL